ncbi:MAG: peptidase, partial [Candidatus Scalindua rubra]
MDHMDMVKDNKNLLQEALKLHQVGNLAAAAIFYNKLLEKQPDNIDAIFLMGTLNLQQGNFDTACMLFRKTLELRPDYAIAHSNLGTALQGSGRLDEAIVNYRKAIELKPDYAEAHYNLGNALKEQRKLEEAVTSYRRAIELKPNDAEIYSNLGNTLRVQGKLDDAVTCYRQAAALKPNNAELHSNLGAALQELGRFDEAILSCKQAIVLKPNYAMAYSNLGSVLQELGKLDEAVASYKKAIALKPDYAEAHNNLGTSFLEQGKLNEAKTNFNQAISLRPDYAEAHNNLGTVLQESGRPEEAILSYKQATILKPDYASAHLNRSFALLLTENFKEGWQEYEWRLHIKGHVSKTSRQPMWDGKPLNDKSVLIQTEQGFGDTIQFVRYLPMVKAQGGRVIFECPQNFLRLLKNCAGIDKIIEKSSTSKLSAQFDVHVPLLSLPGIFCTTLDSIPSDVPYITVDPGLVEQWRLRFGHDNNFKVGIVWAGIPTHRYVYHKRSCSLADLATLAEIPELSFYSLQKGPASVEANNPPKGMKIINLENDLNDFADTAAAITNLDLVISVDTAVAHLTGAIGKPVWTLLHSAPDWRWLLNRDDSPWYPSMRLFRQSKPNDWTGVFEQVKKSLSNFRNSACPGAIRPAGL